MAAIDLSSISAPLNDGILQLQNGVAMSSTLTSVTDQSNTASTLKLSTTSAQFTSPLRITTDDPSDFYLDCEDGSTNNRFSITRNTASQQVNLNFASNPAGSTTIVGAIRTYVDGVNLSEVMTFVENGNVGVGTGATTPAGKFDIVSDGGGQLLFSRYGGQPQINIRRSQGTFAAPTAVVGGASSVLNFQNYDGTSFGTSAQIQSVPENQTPTAKGASLALNVVQAGTTSVINGLIVSSATTTPGSVSITTNFSSASARLSIWQTALSSTLPYFNIQETGGGKLLEFSNAGNLLVGSGSPSDTARVSIKGSGSTSATTSLLVQNSSGTQSLKVTDNGFVNVGDYASNFGGLAIPWDGVSYGTKPFIITQRDGVALFSLISNAILEISAPSLRVQPFISMANANSGIGGPDAQSMNNSSIVISTGVNAYNGTSQNDACNLVYIQNRGSYLQASGSINWLKMDGVVNDLGGGGSKWCTGIYYNPTLTGGTALANSHYCYHATSGQMMVNTTSPNASAQLQVDSTTRGFLPPRMTDAQIRAIVAPAEGLIAYNTDISHLCCYQAGAWVKFSHSPM